MNEAMLLDCTLRDGAYLVDKYFGDEVIHGIIAGLVDANIDIVEIGFLQDEGFGPGKTVYLNGQDAEKFIPKNRGKTMFTVLADFSRYTITNLNPYDGTSFDAVRICFFKDERFDALEYFRAVKEKGYKLFVQPVDILGYTDREIIEFIDQVNKIEPYCFSIVDTFGSMYEDDLQRVFSIIDHNLCPNTIIGFHSHNNMQMSSSLSQTFLRVSAGHRNVVIDSTVSGMGRGAGNTPTELIAQYMVSKLRYHYDIDSLLDVIDNYVAPLKMRVTWGYNTEMFLAGAYSAHVNNISYLKKKNSIRSKDVRFILNKIGPSMRKRYHYDILEKTYMDLVSSEIDDRESVSKLTNEMKGKSVVIVAPGRTATTETDKILRYIESHGSMVISINFEPGTIPIDYIYMNNIGRYSTFLQHKNGTRVKQILTSNIAASGAAGEYIVSFNRLYKCGWQYGDNSAILLLRLLDIIGVSEIAISGLDGYDQNVTENSNYADNVAERPINGNLAITANREIDEMLRDYLATRKSSANVYFITTSRFSKLGDTE